MSLQFWLIEQGLKMVQAVLSLFPATGPSLFPGGVLQSPMYYAAGVVSSLVDLDAMTDVFGFMFMVRGLLLIIAFIRWVWGWVVG